MSDRSVKLLLRVDEAIEVWRVRHPHLKLAGESDVPLSVGLIQEIMTWTRGFKEMVRDRSAKKPSQEFVPYESEDMYGEPRSPGRRRPSVTSNQEDVDYFIRLIRGISPQYLRYACCRGACHRFFLVLKDRFPAAKLYFTKINGGHCVAKIHGLYWDIWGEHDPETDGAVRVPSKDEVRRMSICYFDEGFVLLNPYVIRDDDVRKPNREQV